MVSLTLFVRGMTTTGVLTHYLEYSLGFNWNAVVRDHNNNNNNGNKINWFGYNWSKLAWITKFELLESLLEASFPLLSVTWY